MDNSYLVSIGDQVGDGFAAGVEDLFVLKRGTAQFDDKSHSKPSSSFHPHIRLRFCTAWPEAPFNRLSRQETKTRRFPSGARAKPRSQKLVRTTCCISGRCG